MNSGVPHRKTCKRYDVPWHAHYLTFSCFRRQAFFTGKMSPQWFLESLDAARARQRFDLWAYVIMPEHVHLIILPAEGSKISRILFAIKKPLADRVVAWVRENSPGFLTRMTESRPGGKVTQRFWQAGGGYDRNLWTPKEIHEKVHYVHDNPVRRKLVARPEDWPWSSYLAWERGIDSPLRIDRETVPVLHA